MKLLKKILFVGILFLFLPRVDAATELLKQGSGAYELTLYSDSKVSDVEKVLGSPKLTTDSAFGGHAYSFYTDDNYSNYLYIETTSDGTIASYITFEEGYKTPMYSYGESYPYNIGYVLGGYLLNDDGKVSGGAYYNRYMDGTSASSLVNSFNSTFASDDKYKLGLSKQGVLMFNVLQRKNGKSGSLTFDESVYNLAKSYEDNGEDLRLAINEIGERRAFGLQENVTYQDYSRYTINPLFFARYSVSSTVNSPYTIAAFYYDETRELLWAFGVTESLRDEITSGDFALKLLNKKDVLIEQNILYLTESLKGNFSEKEIISKINQFIQDGNLYERNASDQSYYGVLVNHGAVCAGYSDAMSFLAGTQGVSCIDISSRTQNHAFNLCYADGSWSYYDTQKRLMTPLNDATVYSQIDSISFKSLTDMKNLSYVFDNFATDKKSLLEAFPEGETADFSSKSYVYYDEDYAYYIKKVYEKENGRYEWHSYIIREDRVKGVEKNLTETIYYNRSSAGLVKEGDTLYYVDTNYDLYSMDMNGNSKKKLVTSTAEKQISAVFTREGDLYYAVLNPKTKEAEIVKHKDLTTWPELKIYSLDHSKYAYDLAYIEGTEGVSIIKAIGVGNNLPSGEIYIPDTINGKPVIGIGASAFEAGGNTKAFTGEITLPKYLQYIGDSAFSSNEAITKIHFNDSLISIGKSAFYKMSGLTGSITIPDSVETIGALAFANTTGLEAFTFSNNVEMISRSVLDGATNLKKVTLGNNVAAIGSKAFSDCVNLQTITIPSTTTHIYSDAFKNTENLKTIVIESKNVESMDFLNTNAEIYLYGNSQTGVYAKNNSIPFIDLNGLTGKITLNEKNLKVDFGAEPVQLTYEVTPSIYEDATYTWSSDNSSVATVDQNGKVSFVGVGSTMIHLTGDNGLSASIFVTVSRVNVTDYYLSQDTVWLSPGETVQVTGLILPSEIASTQTINWFNSDSSVATVNSTGLITAKGVGSTTITGRLTSGLAKTVTVVVQDTYVPRDTIVMEYLPGDSAKKYQVINNHGNSAIVQNLSSSNSDVITVLNDEIKVKSGGFTILKGTTDTSGEVEQLVYVSTPVLLSDGSERYAGDLDNNTILDINDFILLKEKTDSTKRDDLLIADINGDGIINDSDLQLFAKIILNQSITIQITYPDIKIESVFPRIGFLSYEAVDDVHFNGTNLWVSYENYTGFYNIPVSWESSNPEVASVDKTGQVTYHKAGHTTITAKLDEEHIDSIDFYLTDQALSFEQAVYRVKVGETITPTVSVPYTNRTNLSVTTYSEDNSVATYQNNQLTGVKEGTTTITYHVDNCAVRAIVIVEKENEILEEDKPIESIQFMESEVHIEENQVKYLTVEFNPYDTTMDTTLSYESSDTSIAEVTNEGKVIAKSTGSAIIKATTVNGKTAEIQIVVEKNAKPIESIILEPKNVTLKVGETKALTVTITPSDTTDDKKVTFTSSNSSVATVDEKGVITAKNVGTTTIKATTINGKSAEVSVVVENASKPIEKIEVTPTNVSLKVGEKEQLSVTITPSDTTDDKTITYTSNNSAVVTVDTNGLVTAKGHGSAVITVATTTGIKKEISVNVAQEAPMKVTYQTQVQQKGWLEEVSDGATSGTTGSGLRMETLKITLENQEYEGDIEYRSHIQRKGWETEWKKNGEESGTVGAGLRLEAIQIRLTGEMAKHYDIYYRIHSQRFGWLDWTKNGEMAGTEGFGYRVEAVEIKLVKKGEAAPGSTTRSYVSFLNTNIMYQTQVQQKGWLDPVKTNQISGTTGSGLRMESMKLWIDSKEISGSIEYKSHVQRSGWESEWKSNGEISGTVGAGLRLEAIQIRLTGEIADHYDIYYRVHSQRFGWLDWAVNGEMAGTSGYGYRVEAIQIQLVKKYEPAPFETENHYQCVT